MGAWLGVHVAKRLVGYRLRTGDLFASGTISGKIAKEIFERAGK